MSLENCRNGPWWARKPFLLCPLLPSLCVYVFLRVCVRVRAHVLDTGNHTSVVSATDELHHWSQPQPTPCILIAFKWHLWQVSTYPTYWNNCNYWTWPTNVFWDVDPYLWGSNSCQVLGFPSLCRKTALQVGSGCASVVGLWQEEEPRLQPPGQDHPREREELV